MITEWLLGLVDAIGVWFANLFPQWTAPPFLADFDSTINGVMQQAAGVGAWVDWVYIIGIVTAVVIVWLASFFVKIARAVASYIPFFGGAG